MTRFAVLATTLIYLPSAVFGYEWLVGVGKSENTGKNGLGFDPSSIRPVGGDTIVFEFHAGTHSVYQTTFENPCTPMSGGFASGDITVPDGTDVEKTGPRKSFSVTDSNPLWFYDGAPNQCAQGGVFSVNPDLTGDKTAEKYLENSMATGGGSGTPSPSDSPSASPSSTPASVSSTPSNTNAPTTATRPPSTSSPASLPSPSGSSSPSSPSSAAPSSTSNAAAGAMAIVGGGSSFSFAAFIGAAVLGAWLAAS